MQALQIANSGVMQPLVQTEGSGERPLQFDVAMHVPIDRSLGCEGALFTGPAQIRWIGQLVHMCYQFSLHIDGKWKLHHGGFVLITLGTHCLKCDHYYRGGTLVA